MLINDHLPEKMKPSIKLGPTLRAAREQQGLSLADVAGKTKLGVHQLTALEAEDFARLPDMAFVRGFVRSYGKLLQLDVPSLLAALPEPPVIEKTTPSLPEVPLASRFAARQRQNLIWMTAAVGMLLLTMFFWLRDSNTPQDTYQDMPPQKTSFETELGPFPVFSAVAGASTVSFVHAPVVSTPVVNVPVVSTPVITPSAVWATRPASAISLTAPVPLHLVFDESAWVEVKERSGKILSSQLNHKGDELKLAGRPPFSVVIGNSLGVHLYYKGAEIDLAKHVSRSDSAIARLELE